MTSKDKLKRNEAIEKSSKIVGVNNSYTYLHAG
ncbi:hypothetical protein RDI58_000421 [Solanum bulbocastanum]|uniref:Uncharacterized protein n=1 Tax=Solanum bulbocastanum TaxID=147425 RepID=A0AAN8U332_SOLBU